MHVVCLRYRPTLPHDMPLGSCIVLLGNGGVGKSTIVRHIKSGYFCNGPTDKEQNGAINAMLKALIQTTSAVCDILLDGEQEGISDGVFECMDTVANIASRGRCHVAIVKKILSRPQEKEQQLLATCLKNVWTNTHVQQCATANNHLSSFTSELCLKDLDRILVSGFHLDIEDFLLIENPTTMMSKSTEYLNGENFELVDVGGQKHFHQVRLFVPLLLFLGMCPALPSPPPFLE